MEYMPILFFIAFFGTVSDGGGGGCDGCDGGCFDAELDAGFDVELNAGFDVELNAEVDDVDPFFDSDDVDPDAKSNAVFDSEFDIINITIIY